MNTATTNILDVKEFLEIIREPLFMHIRKRLEEEIRPQVEKIYQEEIAKFAIDLYKQISIDRFGTDLRIVLHSLPEKSTTPSVTA
jgi:hypothetical protein